jgi:hypothetical protein
MKQEQQEQQNRLLLSIFPDEEQQHTSRNGSLSVGTIYSGLKVENMTLGMISWQWVENILYHKPIEDHRKATIALVLSRYLVNVKKLGYSEAYQLIMQWLVRCADKRRLEPSLSYFERYVVRYQIEEAAKTKRLPMKLTTMQQRFPDMYKTLIQSGDVLR